MKSNRLHTFIINKFRNYNWKYLLVSLILCSSSFVYGQSKLILTTGVDKGWTITKKNQPYPTNPLPPNTDWLINKTPDVLNDQWTDKVVLANITLDQIIPVQNVGNKANPIATTCTMPPAKQVPIISERHSIFQIALTSNRQFYYLPRTIFVDSISMESKLKGPAV